MGVVTSLVAGTIGTAALMGAGGTAAGMAMAAKPKVPKPISLLAMPTPTSSDEIARQEVEKLRRIRAMSGGKTLLTSEGIGSGSGTGLKTLLGS